MQKENNQNKEKKSTSKENQQNSFNLDKNLE